MKMVFETNWKDFKQKVKDVMTDFEETRNDDTLLMFYFWKVSGFTVELDKHNIMVNIEREDLDILPKPESICRCRREIQNTDGELLPTHMQVADKRRIGEDVMRRYYRNDSKMVPIVEHWYTSKIIQ